MSRNKNRRKIFGTSEYHQSCEKIAEIGKKMLEASDEEFNDLFGTFVQQCKKNVRRKPSEFFGNESLEVKLDRARNDINWLERKFKSLLNDCSGTWKHLSSRISELEEKINQLQSSQQTTEEEPDKSMADIKPGMSEYVKADDGTIMRREKRPELDKIDHRVRVIDVDWTVPMWLNGNKIELKITRITASIHEASVVNGIWGSYERKNKVNDSIKLSPFKIPLEL